MSQDEPGEFSEELENAAAAWVFRREAGLTPAEEADFKRWRAADPRHERALTRHQQAWSLLDRPRHSGQARILLQRFVSRASRRRRFAAACGALIVLLAAGTAWQVRRPAHRDAPPTHAVVVLPAQRTLADGSVVELKPGAEIAVDFSGSLRRVLLRRGEAHFQVVKNRRPFVVTAGNVEFRAVGTGFAVQIADAHVELLVTDGRVAVEKTGMEASAGRPSALPGPESPQALATVEAGSRMVVGAGTTSAVEPPVHVTAAEMTARLAWRAPRLEFTETPLAEAVALMNRHNRVQFVIDDAVLSRRPISGLFRADHTEGFVRILEKNFGVTAEQSGETIRLRRVR